MVANLNQTNKPSRASGSEATITQGTPFELSSDDTGDAEQPGMTDAEVVEQILEYRREAFDAKQSRMKRNSLNRDAFMSIQDWTHKLKGQSTEFLPKVATSIEQFSAYVKRALTQFGNWFSIEMDEFEPVPILTDGQIRNLVSKQLSHLPDGVGKTKAFETLMADATKEALLESLMILKVHGQFVDKQSFHVEPGQPLLRPDGTGGQMTDPTLGRTSQSYWRLSIDLVKTEDYYPDPTGRGLYEIHEVERDYHDVLALARKGIYDEDVVSKIKEDFQKQEAIDRRAQQLGQDRSKSPSFRRRILITEFWGSIVSKDGEVPHKNCLAAVANKKYLIRKPEDNPFWHGLSPFVSAPLIRVPFSVWHKALYDSAVDLNFALNEMFNLMLDGGISSVWGIKQLRSSYLENQSQVSGGIEQGATLLVSSELPMGEKVLETVSEGEIPSDAMAIFEMVAREFTQAALTNDIKLGSLPPRQVKATEVVSADQSQAVTLDSISSDLEHEVMEPVLQRAWITILQHLSLMDPDEVKAAVGPQAFALLASISDAERFSMLATYAKFKVSGLSATLARVRDFQQTMALMQVVMQSPVLMQAFMQSYSVQRVLKMSIKQLNINPDDIAATPDEKAAMPQLLQQIMAFAQMMNGQQQGQEQGGQPGLGSQNAPTSAFSPGGRSGGVGTVPGGDSQVPAEVNQMINPLTGISR